MNTSIDCTKEWVFTLPDFIKQEYTTKPEEIEKGKIKFTFDYGDGRDGMIFILDTKGENKPKNIIKATYQSYDSVQSGQINFKVLNQGNLLEGAPQGFPGTIPWKLKVKISDPVKAIQPRALKKDCTLL